MPHPSGGGWGWAALRGIGRYVPPESLIFGGVYGTVLAGALAAALDEQSGTPDPGYDALWVLMTALASSAAHGYARVIAAHPPPGRSMTAIAVRSVLAEWPLTAAVMPTVLLLLTSYAGWWAEINAVSVALAFNTVALFFWGLWASRTAGGRSWPTACRAGGVDMAIGLLIVLVNLLTK
jgi:cobalamin synthase